MNIIIKKGIESRKGSNDSRTSAQGLYASMSLLFKPF